MLEPFFRKLRSPARRGPVRIAVLGSSFTGGVGVGARQNPEGTKAERRERRYSRLLQQKLEGIYGAGSVSV